MTDEQNYTSATKAFQQKYGMLPGDFTGATTFWGAMSTCPPAPGQASSGGTVTCNGNGDGQIGPGQYNNNTLYERLLYWQHLANAQMIQGNYTGIAGSTAGEPTYGVNVPASRINGGEFIVGYVGLISSADSYSTWFYGNYGHVFEFGTGTNGGPILTIPEAQYIDVKYDDGLPATGNMRVLENGNGLTAPNCASTAAASTAVYSHLNN